MTPAVGTLWRGAWGHLARIAESTTPDTVHFTYDGHHVVVTVATRTFMKFWRPDIPAEEKT